MIELKAVKSLHRDEVLTVPVPHLRVEEVSIVLRTALDRTSALTDC